MNSPTTTCLDQQRRRDLVNSGANGVDSVHVSQPDRRHVRVVLFRDWKNANKANFRIEGGRRVQDIRVESVNHVHASGFGLLDLTLNKQGDDSEYILKVIDAKHADQPPSDFDARFASAKLLFSPVSVADQDCAAKTCGPEIARPGPTIDYLAKDYSSFRRLMLDRLSQTIPAWGERRAADLGITVVEALAYVADHLSYFQDAVATEAYLETARHRISVRRHCRLVDYRMHEGCNARAWVHVEVQAALSAEGLTFFTQPGQAARNQSRKPVRTKTDLESPEEADRIVFEPVRRVDLPMPGKTLLPSHNEIRFYTWGDNECCLPRGATSATLEAARGEWVKPDKNESSGWKWEDDQLPRIGDLLLFEEVLGPRTGLTADADPQHRHVVRLTRVVRRIDRRPKGLTVPADQAQPPVPTYKQKAATAPARKDKKPAPYQEPATPALPPTPSFEEVPVLEINWDAADALPFSLCLSTGGLNRVSVARGNILLTDHGLTLKDPGDRNEGIEMPGLPTSIDSAPSACDGSRLQFGNQPQLARSRRFSVVPFPHRWSGLQHLAGQADNLNQHGRPIARPLMYPLTESVPYPDQRIQSRSQSRGLARWQAERLADNRRGPHRREYTQASTENLPHDSDDLQSSPNKAGTADMPAHFSESFVARLISHCQAGRTLTTGDCGSFLELNVDRPQAEPLPDFIGPAIYDLQPDPRQSRTSITLTELVPQQPVVARWQWAARCDLLASGPQDRHFVVEIDDDGIVWLRFGDGQNGMTPRSGTRFSLEYRIGNGVTGNVGAEAITGVVGDNSRLVRSVRNPLPARGGVDPEPVATARLLAPTAFRKRQLRAVVADDYAKLAATDDRVQRAMAELRWNGHGYEVQVAVDFKASALSGADDIAAEEQLIRHEIEAELSYYRRMSHDVRVVPPHEVPLNIKLRIVVESHVEQGRVKTAVRESLSSRERHNGSRGFFHPDNLTFGQRIDASAIVTRVSSVPGVISVEVLEFRRRFGPAGNGLAAGTLVMGPLEIARLDDDPAFPEHGRLELQMEGGR